MDPGEQVVHKKNNIRGEQPLCWPMRRDEEALVSENIDDLTCVDCLRRLAKDAVVYGRGRKASREW